MSATLFFPSPLVLDADGRIDRDLPCLECRYNLRMRTLADACPECGMAVRISARADRLDEAADAYQRQLLGGAAGLKRGVWLALPLLYPGALYVLPALWRLTAGQSGRSEPRFDWQIRVGSRVLIAAAGAVFLMMLIILGYLRFVAGVSFTTGELQQVDALFIASHALYALGLLALWQHLLALAQRSDDPALVRAGKRIRMAYVAGLAAFALISAMTGLVDQLFIARLLVYRFPDIVYPMIPVVLLAAVMLWLWWETRRFAGYLHQSWQRLLRR